LPNLADLEGVNYPTNAGGKNQNIPRPAGSIVLLHTVGGSTLGPLGNTLGKGCNGYSPSTVTN